MKTKVHAYSASNRVGRFKILHEVLNNGNERPLLQALFGLCVVLHTELHESGRGKLFIAASDLFEPLSEGQEIPEYRIEAAWPDKPFAQPWHEQGSLQSGQFRFKAIRKNIVRVPPIQVRLRPGAVN